MKKRAGNELNKLVVDMYLCLKNKCVMADSTRSFLYASLKRIENVFRETYELLPVPWYKRLWRKARKWLELE